MVGLLAVPRAAVRRPEFRDRCYEFRPFLFQLIFALRAHVAQHSKSASSMRTKTLTLTAETAQRRLNRILKLLPEAVPAARKLARGVPLHADVSFVSAPRMQAMNRKFRGKNRPTDVLSFEAPEFYRAQGMLGELVICLPVLRAQAKEHGHPARNELDVLLVHGALHLLGLDHERSAGELAQMLRLENRVLKLLSPRKSLQSGLIGRNGD